MSIGKLLIVLGCVVAALGLVMTYAPWLLSWFGRLPGDIRIVDDKKIIFIPLTSMLVVSVVISLVFHLLSFFK
ncbi:MAG: DUF2905 domain-containing protein [Gammaproteobacteria bacterium HGW-Gammaproteobacteria-3]|nr:MAG: DUF2905 domain-containing protein [Gammaproteobacteria bacterium HGW-Gammaproteobacteria-3]